MEKKNVSQTNAEPLHSPGDDATKVTVQPFCNRASRRFSAMILPFPKCFAHSSSGHSDDDSDSTREEQRQTEGTGEREPEEVTSIDLL